MFALEKDGKGLDDFPEKIDIEGTFIVRASKQDMIDMVDGVYDWGGNNNEEPAPSRREQEPPRRERSRRRRVEDDDF